MPTTQKPNQLYSSNHIRTGDVLLVKSHSGLLSKLIGLLSSSYFVHAAIAVRIDRHLYVVECKYSNRFSYQLSPIDWWLARNDGDQLFIGKMPTSGEKRGTRRQVRDTIMSTTESLRPYRISWLAAVYFMQILMGKKRPQFKHLFKNTRPLVCSTLVQEAWERAGVISQRDYMTPADLVEMLGGEAALTPVYQQHHSQFPRQLEASNDAGAVVPEFASA